MNEEFILKEGIKLGEGRYRKVYELNEYVYKIDSGRTKASNRAEFEIFNSYETNILNPIYEDK